MAATKRTHEVETAHVFAADAARVFDAWLDPRLAREWFGPGLGETKPVEIDPRVGGTFRIVQIRDGRPVGHSGRYLALERPTHLAFTWETDDDEASDEVHVHITPEGAGSSVRVVHTVDEEWKEYAESIRRSWTSMMQEMDRLLG